MTGNMNAEQWGEILSEMAERWPKWSPTDTELEDFRAYLSRHPASIVRTALREVKRRYSSYVPQLKWVTDACDALDTARAVEEHDDGSMIVADIPDRHLVLSNLAEVDPVNVEAHRNGHWHQRIECRMHPANAQPDPDDWDALMLALVWQSTRESVGRGIPTKTVSRPPEATYQGDDMTGGEFVRRHPGGFLARLSATNRKPEDVIG